MKDRAYRRQQEHKRKKQCAKVIKQIWHEPDLAKDEKRIGKMAHVRGICACRMCGNPRKYFKEETKQEKINKDKSKEIDEENY